MTVAAVSKIPYPSFPFVGHPYIEILSLLDGEKEKKEGRKGRARGRRLGRNFPGGRLSNTPVSASPDNHWNAIKHDL